ncbi:MAG: hypothetical protein JST59_25720 [Actinobacteria bacterium]|nr:hypothetical protein [Actinomycetota bacterium]
MSRLYFPLRSSVEFFADPNQLTPMARAKEGAVLFEEILFEDGQLIATVGEKMNWAMHRPRHELTKEDLEEARAPAGPGESMVIAIGTEDAPGEGAKEMRTIGETMVMEAYKAQWHSAAIDELRALEVPWFGIATPTDETLQNLATPMAQAARELAGRIEDEGLSPMQVDFAAKALARDALFAAVLGAAINVTPMFGRMIEDSPTLRGTGADALAFLVPDLGHLPWEVIAEHRERPGSVEARALLREFEVKALVEEPGDVADYLEKVKGSVMDALAAALLETEVNLPEVVGREAVNVAVSFVPIAGAALGPAAGIVAALGERAEQRENGLFSLVKLRQAR